MKEKWKIPENHPIKMEAAKQLIAGPYGSESKKIAKACCAPIYWCAQVGNSLQIVQNGTITFVKTPRKVLGVTAAHVLRKYEEGIKNHNFQLFIMNKAVPDILHLKIDTSTKFDIATLHIDDTLLTELGPNIYPLSTWPPKPPEEGRGILIGGYPAKGIVKKGPTSANFTYASIISVAKKVSETQITWSPQREFQIKDLKTKEIPPNYDFGGLSGGPLLGLFEGKKDLVHFKLSGIIIESNSNLENLIGIRADIIREDGTISKI